MTWIFYTVGVVAVLLGWSAFFGAPYVPSKRRDVHALFHSKNGVPLSPRDTVLDIGSGDGVVLLEAQQCGAHAVGYEIHPLFVAVSRFRLRRTPRVQVVWANMWHRPFPSAVTVVYAFSVNRDARPLVRKLQREAHRLARPFTFVCYGNPLPELTPDRSFGAYTIYTITPLQPHKA